MKMRGVFFARERGAPKHTRHARIYRSRRRKRTGSTPGRCHFRHYRRPGVISDVIGKASTVKGFASAREPFRIFHISLTQSQATRRAIFPEAADRRSLDDLSHRAAPRRGHEKRNTILFRYHRCSHYPKRSQYLHFLQRNRAP